MGWFQSGMGKIENFTFSAPFKLAVRSGMRRSQFNWNEIVFENIVTARLEQIQKILISLI
jgi:hypothetical protein